MYMRINCVRFKWQDAVDINMQKKMLHGFRGTVDGIVVCPRAYSPDTHLKVSTFSSQNEYI